MYAFELQPRGVFVSTEEEVCVTTPRDATPMFEVWEYNSVEGFTVYLTEGKYCEPPRQFAD